MQQRDIIDKHLYKWEVGKSCIPANPPFPETKEDVHPPHEPIMAASSTDVGVLSLIHKKVIQSRLLEQKKYRDTSGANIGKYRLI